MVNRYILSNFLSYGQFIEPKFNHVITLNFEFHTTTTWATSVADFSADISTTDLNLKLKNLIKTGGFPKKIPKNVKFMDVRGLNVYPKN